MPEIQPFCGVLYRVPSAQLAKVLSPPYDVIPPAYQEELYARDPRNIVRVVLNRANGEARYRDAADIYRRWLAEGVLAADEQPALYVLEQAFAHEGRTLRRYSLLARFKAEPAEGGTILPHEQTRAAAVEDRYRLLEATRANFSPILLMFPDPGSRFSALISLVIAAPAILTYTDDGGVGHRLWRVTDADTIASLQGILARQKAYIADGHHRHATALRRCAARGPEGGWTFGCFTPIEAPGLAVLPYHRILSEGPTLNDARRALQGSFRLTPAADDAAAARAAQASQAPYAFGLAEAGGGALVAEALPEAGALLGPQVPPALRALDTHFFHQVVLARLLRVPEETVSYVHSLGEAEAALRKGTCRLAALMRATPIRQIVDVAEARGHMPPKSTFFHPKLPSGLVVHPLPD